LEIIGVKHTFWLASTRICGVLNFLSALANAPVYVTSLPIGYLWRHRNAAWIANNSHVSKISTLYRGGFCVQIEAILRLVNWCQSRHAGASKGILVDAKCVTEIILGGGQK